MSGILQLINTFPSGGFAVKNSLRFRSSASAYLSRTPASAGSQTTWTWSGWVKRGTYGSRVTLFSAFYGNSGRYAELDFENDDSIFWNAGDYTTGGSTTTNSQLKTSSVYRDFSAWYHIVFCYDTTQPTSTNRLKLYVNGVQVTAFSVSTYPSQNSSTFVNATNVHSLSTFKVGEQQFDGYLAEVNFIDGQALTPSSFGAFDATSGVWQPVRYSGTYGTNGFYLKFSDTTSTTTLCYDYSGNGNNWTPNNISLTSGSTYDSMLDSPTNYDNGGNGVGNYAVLNPLNNLYFGGTISGGNLNLNYPASPSDYAAAASSIAIQSGTKVYFELVSTTATYPLSCGIRKVGTNPATGEYLGFTANEYTILQANGNKINNNVSSSYGVSFGANDVLGCAVDLVNGTIYWSKNGTWMNSGDPAAGTGYAFSGLSGDYYACVGTIAGGNTCTGSVNFGQRPFAYTPPTGFKALNTQNLPAASIVNGASFMAATLYTGNGSTQSISNANNGVSFQPDFVWGKARNDAGNHMLADSVRGPTLRLISNLTNAEDSGSALTAFNTNGFSLNSASAINQNGDSLVAWQWKANGATVTNTAGSITSQVSANTTAGFSVVTYTGNGVTGATVGHGLGVKPALIIAKYRGGVSSWPVYHQSLGANYWLLLNSTNAATNSSQEWNNTEPTASVFSIGSSSANDNQSGPNVAYCFAAIPGYSAFGSYTGNGSADGPFVYCGFRPRFLLVKSAAGTSAGLANWLILDTSRSPSNVADYKLAPNLSEAENGASIGGAGSNSYDILSNGFKARTTNGSSNENGSTFIYAAFAENPLKYSLAR